MTSKITVNYPSGIIETEITTPEEFAAKMKSIATLMFNSPCEITFSVKLASSTVTVLDTCEFVSSVIETPTKSVDNVPEFDVLSKDVFYKNNKMDVYENPNGYTSYNISIPTSFGKSPNKWKYLQVNVGGHEWDYILLISRKIIGGRTSISIPCCVSGHIFDMYLDKWTSKHKVITPSFKLNGSKSHSAQPSLDA